jgi:hypothetical protein
MLTTSGTQKQLAYLYPPCWLQARRSKQVQAYVTETIEQTVQDSGGSEAAQKQNVNHLILSSFIYHYLSNFHFLSLSVPCAFSASNSYLFVYQQIKTTCF